LTLDDPLRDDDWVNRTWTRCFLVLVVAAGAAPESSERESPTATPPSTTLGSDPVDTPISPHPKFPSDWRVFKHEPLEIQVGPGHFLSGTPSQELTSGDRLSRWPIYGAIVARPN
jgi:hypothetical protein